MRLTSYTDFGLRALMRLAAEPERSFTTDEIAGEFEISRHHLIKVVRGLAEAGYVTTQRGAAYCDFTNDHYGAYAEPSWAHGGSKPFIVPWLALPQIGFRYKPIKQFEARFDAGFSISGFFLGLAASYGL